MDSPFIIEQVYDAPLEKVWQALTGKDALKKWYFPQIEKFKPIPRYAFEFSDDGSRYQKKWIVTQVIEGKKLAHRWEYQGFKGSSEVIFEVFEEGTNTKLRVTHIGLASFPDDPHFARQRFVDGWKRILGSDLKNYLKGI